MIAAITPRRVRSSTRSPQAFHVLQLYSSADGHHAPAVRSATAQLSSSPWTAGGSMAMWSAIWYGRARRRALMPLTLSLIFFVCLKRRPAGRKILRVPAQLHLCVRAGVLILYINRRLATQSFFCICVHLLYVRMYLERVRVCACEYVYLCLCLSRCRRVPVRSASVVLPRLLSHLFRALSQPALPSVHPRRWSLLWRRAVTVQITGETPPSAPSASRLSAVEATPTASVSPGNYSFVTDGKGWSRRVRACLRAHPSSAFAVGHIKTCRWAARRQVRAKLHRGALRAVRQGLPHELSNKLRAVPLAEPVLPHNRLASCCDPVHAPRLVAQFVILWLPIHPSFPHSIFRLPPSSHQRFLYPCVSLFLPLSLTDALCMCVRARACVHVRVYVCVIVFSFKFSLSFDYLSHLALYPSLQYTHLDLSP